MLQKSLLIITKAKAQRFSYGSTSKSICGSNDIPGDIDELIRVKMVNPRRHTRTTIYA